MQSMIKQLHDVHPGATISVVGSGPSATSFGPEDCDVSICLNGAALLPWRFDYFVCAARMAPQQRWFHKKCSRSRVIGAKIATMDHQLYPKEFDESLGERRVYESPPDLPPPAHPHYLLAISEPSQQGVAALMERRAETLMGGGTISGLAVQLAFLMGAAQIHLYGCSFSAASNRAAGYYFYDAPPEQIGPIVASQAEFMDLFLSLIRTCGTKVVLHGVSTLRQFDESVVSNRG